MMRRYLVCACWHLFWHLVIYVEITVAMRDGTGDRLIGEAMTTPDRFVQLSPESRERIHELVTGWIDSFPGELSPVLPGTLDLLIRMKSALETLTRKDA